MKLVAKYFFISRSFVFEGLSEIWINVFFPWQTCFIFKVILTL